MLKTTPTNVTSWIEMFNSFKYYFKMRIQNAATVLVLQNCSNVAVVLHIMVVWGWKCFCLTSLPFGCGRPVLERPHFESMDCKAFNVQNTEVILFWNDHILSMHLKFSIYCRLVSLVSIIHYGLSYERCSPPRKTLKDTHCIREFLKFF